MKNPFRLPKGLLPVFILLLAAVMTVVLSVRVLELKKDVNEKTALLSKSRAAWEQTAADKEALQKELTEVRNQIREAELSLNEANEKASGLRTEIDALQKELESLPSGDS